LAVVLFVVASGATQQAGHLFVVVIDLKNFNENVNPFGLQQGATVYASDILSLASSPEYQAIGARVEESPRELCQRAQTCDLVTVVQRASLGGSRSEFYYGTQSIKGPTHRHSTQMPIVCQYPAQGSAILTLCLRRKRPDFKVFVDTAEAREHWRRRRGS
jgi:hypothetical protein